MRSAKIGKSPEIAIGHSADCGPGPAAIASGGCAQRRVGIDQVARQLLDAGGLGERQADMARLHLRARPGEHRLALEALGMVEAVDASLASSSRLAATMVQKVSDDLLAGRHAHLAAQRQDRIEREALAGRQAGVAVEGGGVGDGAAAADEGAAVRLGLGVARDAGAAGDEMRERDVRLVRGALVARARRSASPLVGDLGLRRTSWRRPDGRCRWLRGASTSSAIGGHLDVAVGIAVVEDGQAAAFAIRPRRRRCIRLRCAACRRALMNSPCRRRRTRARCLALGAASARPVADHQSPVVGVAQEDEGARAGPRSGRPASA